jgi:predicted secreted protein
MASFAFTNAFVSVNAVDLSTFVRSVTINVEAEDLEDTAMGDTFRSRIAGLKDWSVDIEWNQDFAAAAVDVTVWALLGTVTAVIVKPVNTTTAVTNPQYSGNVLVSEYNPLDGSVGDLATTSVSWPGAGTLSRATS